MSSMLSSRYFSMGITMRTLKTNRNLLRGRVDDWCGRLKVGPRAIRVQRMTRKWGSCSSGGIITLAADLADQDSGFQDFVIAHELLHLRVPNHGRLFKALLTAYFPLWRHYDLMRRVQSK